MFQVLYDFYLSLFFNGIDNEGFLNEFLDGRYFNLFGQETYLSSYLAFIMSFISLIIILVICCLFIKKIYNMCAHIIG